MVMTILSNKQSKIKNEREVWCLLHTVLSPFRKVKGRKCELETK